MQHHGKLAAYISICVVVALAIFLALYFIFPEVFHPAAPSATGTLTATTLDTGDSDCHVIVSPDGRVMVIDAGLQDASEHICEYLHAQGIEEIDALVLTHPHKDHIGGAAALIGDCLLYTSRCV